MSRINTCDNCGHYLTSHEEVIVFGVMQRGQCIVCDCKQGNGPECQYPVPPAPPKGVYIFGEYNGK